VARRDVALRAPARPGGAVPRRDVALRAAARPGGAVARRDVEERGAVALRSVPCGRGGHNLDITYARFTGSV
jgi:hypothetical protein